MSSEAWSYADLVHVIHHQLSQANPFVNLLFSIPRLAIMSVESLRPLEQVRQRLNTLANSIGKLLHDLDSNDPLPSWYATKPNRSLATAH